MNRRKKLLRLRNWIVLLWPVLLLCSYSEDVEQAGSTESAVPVEVATAQRRTIRDVLTRVGSIRATQTVEVRPEISGIIRQVRFQEGDAVEQGQLLFSLDDRKLRKQLAAQEAALKEARSRADFAALMYKRFDTLLEEEAVAVAERDRRKTELEAARAQIDRLRAEKALLKERLQDTQIRAAIKGVVTESMVDTGDFVSAGDLLTVLYSLPLEARFSVPESFAARVSKGQTVNVRVGAYPDTSFSGTVSFISPGVDEQTRTFLAKAGIEDPNHELKSGMFATVNVILETQQDKPVIPAEALVATQKGYIVYVVQEGVARRRAVNIGLRRLGAVQIIQGLKEGQTVVTSGQMRLRDGREVTVSQAPSETPQAQQVRSDTQDRDRGRETAR